MKLFRKKHIKFYFLSILLLFIIDACWFEKFITDWSYYDISGQNENKINVIQLTDLHLESIKSFHTSIAERINKTKPDIVFITGDAVDEDVKLPVLHEFLQMIDSSIQKIAILGNWEHWGDVDLVELEKVYNDNNGILLINEHITFEIKNRTLTVIGVDDLIGGTPDFEKSVEGIDASDKTIMLAHCPKYRDIISQKNNAETVDLILSGHTHGGQVSILGYIPFKPRGSGEYLNGWYKEDGIDMYVSKGVGTSILPLRFLSRSEVVEFDL